MERLCIGELNSEKCWGCARLPSQAFSFHYGKVNYTIVAVLADFHIQVKIW